MVVVVEEEEEEQQQERGVNENKNEPKRYARLLSMWPSSPKPATAHISMLVP